MPSQAGYTVDARPEMTRQEAEGGSACSTPLVLTCDIAAGGEARVAVCGELDIASADGALGYVRDVIDRCRSAVILDLADLVFCDARGLGTLVRMSSYAEKAGCPLWLSRPRPHVLRIMRICGLDRVLQVRNLQIS
jgi:anti-sigma B factor antagonist